MAQIRPGSEALALESNRCIALAGVQGSRPPRGGSSMRSRILLAGAVVLVAAVAAVIGCSKNGNKNPYSPSGGTTGTTLNLSLASSGGSASFTFNTAGTFPYTQPNPSPTTAPPASRTSTRSRTPPTR